MRHRCGCVRGAHIVGVVWPRTAMRGRWWTPAVTVDFPVVGVAVVEVWVVEVAHERVVGRHCPVEVRGCHRATEAQILCRAVHSVAIGVVEPDARQIKWHIDFFTGVGIVAVEPNLVVFAVHRLSPHLVDDDISCKLVFIAAVYHQFILGVKCRSHSFCLRTGEIAY